MRDYADIEQWLRGGDGEETPGDTTAGSGSTDDLEKVQYWHEVRLLELEARKKKTICQRISNFICPPRIDHSTALDMQYNHECLTLTVESTPDPFVVRAHRQYYMTFTKGNRIEIWTSKYLASFEESARKAVIWRPPPCTEHSADLWAPELHAIRGRWYIYYAAANPARGSGSHRMYVLGGPPANEDPTLGQWEFLGRILGMPDQWATDGTVFELDNTLYFVYSGWPLDDHGHSDLTQQLFILKLDDPTIAASHPVMISAPEHTWEFTSDDNGAHGINEGPQFLESPDGKWKGIVYSAAGSWTHQYKLAVLHYNGGDPLNPRSWPKSQQPLLQASGHSKGPWGPGHGNFLSVGDETICVFHGTDSQHDGWENRKARCQRVVFSKHGPYMGNYCGRDSTAKQVKGSLVSQLRRRFSKPQLELNPEASKSSLKLLLENY
ncbi:hypothetical protein PFICI_06980 [Pestalotiopsis fici W106-1]|uniref:Uncharacterized protein n=1 Tax=Pestalotiopsis fici (strain W106-1 / CGMCC3.15140) TaxID=1229662 RepID=W3X784_PESFW|nr:uncharacterized protein PFICI_06980 [Pestalotiopsis fici W106-1]ETS81978.1 hypothetical protein PFICI_06980 [Pestalotiopsis fici W106-1]